MAFSTIQPLGWGKATAMHVWQLLAAFERWQNSRFSQQSHIHEEDLERFALDAVDGVERITIELHTRMCETCRKKLEESQFFAARLQALRRSQSQAAGKERRRDVRYEIREPAIISASRADFESFDCSVIDVSESGLRIRGPREVYRGSDVRVRVENAVVFGRIRYSRRVAEDAFDCGIEIEQVIVGSHSSHLRDRTRTALGGAVGAVAAPRINAVTPGERVSRNPVEILLVEDNPGDVKLTTAMLQDTAIPHHLTVASDGAQALELLDFAEPKPDFVLLDLNLPKVSGFDVLQHIRSAQALCTIRVVVLSCSAATYDVRRAQELGIEAYIQKPDQFEEYAGLGSRIGALITQTSTQAEPVTGRANETTSIGHQTLFALLKQRFSQVSYRSDGRYEIDGRFLLSSQEAQALVEKKVTLEEIVIYRDRPSHLMPEHVRLALCRPNG